MKNELITIDEENIYLEFVLNNKQYAVLSNSKDIQENDEVYFAIIEEIEGMKILRNINSEEEYNSVIQKYEKILNRYEGMEDENE